MELKLKDWFTLANAGSGMVAIMLTLWAYSYAWVFILASFLFDYLDGKSARDRKDKNEFGKQLDSLADMVSFGVAPVFLAAAVSSSYITLAAGVIYVCAAVLRLAKFNIQEESGVFYGLPTPGAAAVVLIAFLVAPSIVSLALVLCGVAMLMGYKWKKPAF